MPSAILKFSTVRHSLGLADAFDVAFAGGSPAVLIGVVIGSLIYAAVSYYMGMKMSLAVNQAKEIQRRPLVFSDYSIYFRFYYTTAAQLFVYHKSNEQEQAKALYA